MSIFSKQSIIIFNYFFSINDANLYANDDIDYLINMIRLNEKSIEKSKSINMIYGKAMATLKNLCKDLYLNKLGEKINSHYGEVRIMVWIILALVYPGSLL